MAGRSTLYPFLKFDANVDWKNVDPSLLQKLNGMAAKKHVVVDVFSGYRSSEHSQAVGGFAGDPHTKGIAVDANVNGKPIGSVFSAKEFKAAGLITGNQPNFYKGKPDPSHVQISAPSTGGDSTAASTTAQSDSQPSDPAVTPASPVTPDLTLTPETPPPTAGQQPGVDVQMPGSVNYVSNDLSSMWQTIASQGFSSPDSQQFAQNASILGG